MIENSFIDRVKNNKINVTFEEIQNQEKKLLGQFNREINSSQIEALLKNQSDEIDTVKEKILKFENFKSSLSRYKFKVSSDCKFKSDIFGELIHETVMDVFERKPDVKSPLSDSLASDKQFYSLSNTPVNVDEINTSNLLSSPITSNLASAINDVPCCSKSQKRKIESSVSESDESIERFPINSANKSKKILSSNDECDSDKELYVLEDGFELRTSDVLISGSSDKTCKIFNLKKKNCIRTLNEVKNELLLDNI